MAFLYRSEYFIQFLTKIFLFVRGEGLENITFLKRSGYTIHFLAIFDELTSPQVFPTEPEVTSRPK